VRINDLGVMFVADHTHDTRDTRFARVTEVETFTARDRGFVLAGGTDGGLSLFEVIPGGRLFHHRTIAQETGWTLDNLAGLHAVAVGAEVQVFAASTTQPGLTQFALPLGPLGPRLVGGAGDDALTGTPGADMLIGFSGNDTLTGGAGDDVLIGGTGANRYIGGPGADTFVISGGGQTDLIVDFQRGIDRIDLSGWGMLYDVSALSIRGRGNGADIAFGGETLRIVSDDGSRIDPASWTNDDFLF
jgi:Ca2+-binding RTX toxin-like protein